jgi:hypothetical protein
MMLRPEGLIPKGGDRMGRNLGRSTFSDSRVTGVGRRRVDGRASRRRHWAISGARCGRHLPIAVQHRVMSPKMRGHDNDHGSTGNSMSLVTYQHAALRAWQHWLKRRSQRRSMPWERFRRCLQDNPLPPPKVRNPWAIAKRNHMPRSRMRSSRTSGSVGSARRASAFGLGVGSPRWGRGCTLCPGSWRLESTGVAPGSS